MALDNCVHQNRTWMVNYSIFNNSRDLLNSYFCQYGEYQDSKRIFESVETYAVLVFSLFGFLGGLLTISTLAQKSFRVPDFFLFRLVGYLETVQMSVSSSASILGLTRCMYSYSCMIFWAHMATTIINVSSDTVDLIVLFLCVERTVACVLPHFFHYFHSMTCWISVAIVSFVVTIMFTTVQAFEITVIQDEKTKKYSGKPSEFAESSFYDLFVRVNTVRFYVTASLMATATVCSILGFTMMGRRKRKLQKKSKRQQHTSSSRRSERKNSDQNDVSKRTSRLQRDLCCLQMCLAVPVVINHMLYAMVSNTNYHFELGQEAFEKNLTYSTAVAEIRKAERFMYFRMATNMSSYLGHGLHFYLYLMFSLKVRKGFRQLFSTLSRKVCNRGRIGKNSSIEYTSTRGGTVVIEPLTSMK